jgi:carbon monoxide dehydrogenase subunit G
MAQSSRRRDAHTRPPAPPRPVWSRVRSVKRVSATAVIPAPPDELFGFLADPTNLPAWQTGIVSAEKTTAGAVGIGSKAHVVRQLLGQRLAVDLVMTGYQPGRKLVLTSGASGIEVEATLTLAPAGAETRLTFEMAIKAQNIFMAPMEGMVAGAAEKDLADSLDRLRQRFAAA